MRNVIVFAVGGAHYAVELRWVREVTKLGHITPVPGGPESISGVVNSRGAIVPVLSMSGFEGARRPRPGDAAILVEVEGTRAALSIDNVHSVSTLDDSVDAPGRLAAPGGGEPIPLIDPPGLIRDATVATQTTAQEAG